MEESATDNVSTAVYHYLCHNIVGSEEYVNTIRMMNSVRDNSRNDKKGTIITSGSFGEGLQMRGSDLDIMVVIKLVEVSEDTAIYFNDDKKIFLKMEHEDTHPGFTMLRLVHCKNPNIVKECEVVGSNFYLSNSSFKRKFLNKNMSMFHGPCLSDEREILDCAYCLHSKLWITPAKKWVTRSNNSWPNYDVKQNIVKHGVLFVPVGVKGSTQEELEWRISFSVGEKLLITTFTHAQLLCYAVMKILLKDVITLDKNCKELLCSYFIKTILFWICEELPLSIWKPENLISCYMRCFRRLIYCVEYTFCPHYFIPEFNLFENKIEGKAQKTLLNKLHIINRYGWQCIFLSDQMSNFDLLAFGIRKEPSYLHVKSVEQILSSRLFLLNSIEWPSDFLFENVIYKVLSSKSSKLKHLYINCLSNSHSANNKLLRYDDMSGNKYTYKQFTTCISYLLLNTNHDAVAGWLMLASFFYRAKQYNTVLCIVQTILFKCSPEKLHKYMKFSDFHHELFNSHLLRKMTIVQLWKFFLVDLVLFKGNHKLVPAELRMNQEYVIPPVVYAHFISCLCHFHLRNSRKCVDAIRDLQLTIQENYLIAIQAMKAPSYKILGISFELIGDMQSARQAFMRSIELFKSKG